MTTKVITYIDGFNLYHALRRKGWQRYNWLNLRKFSQCFLEPDQVLVTTKYFTARFKNDPPKEKRQGLYIDSLNSLKDLEIIEGRFQKKKRTCRQCNHSYRTYEEKMTDVHIAVALLEDAVNDRFDTALLVSADGDLVPPIKTVKRIFPEKRIVVIVPPASHGAALQATADANLTVWRTTLRRSQFPKKVKRADGKIVERPTSW